MASVDEVQSLLKVLREFYGDKDGHPRQMNDVQVAVYTDGLVEFDAPELEAAARRWMATSKWWPMLSDLRELLIGKTDWAALGHLAWTTFERAVRRAGLYAGATFEDPAIGECVRQTFGTWPVACSFDVDSPGWAMRKQTFLAIFPTMAAQATEPVTMRGLSDVNQPLLIPHVAGFPAPKALAATGGSGRDALAEVRKRFSALAGPR